MWRPPLRAPSERVIPPTKVSHVISCYKERYEYVVLDLDTRFIGYDAGLRRRRNHGMRRWHRSWLGEQRWAAP